MIYSKFLLIFFILIFGIPGQWCDLHVNYVPSNEFKIVNGKGKYNNSGPDGCGKLEDAIVLTEFNQDIDIEIPDGTVYFKHIFDECAWRQIIVNVKTVDKPKSAGKVQIGQSSQCVPMVAENVVKVNVQGATKNCPIKVIGAKRWLSPSPKRPTKPATPKISIKPAPPPSTTSSGSSVADSGNEAIWNVAGILCGIFLLSIGAGLGYWIYSTRNRRKGGKRYGRKIKAMPSKNILRTSTPLLKQKPSNEVTKEPTKAETEKPKICIIKSAKAETECKKEAVAEVPSMSEMMAQEEIQNDSIIPSPSLPSNNTISEEVELVEEPVQLNLPQLPLLPSKNTISKEAEHVEVNLPQLPPQFSTTISTSSPKATKNESQKSSQQPDSLPENAPSESSNFKKDKIEAHYASLLRSKFLNSSKAREMRRKYPRNACRQLRHREIKLFSSTIGEMFIEVNKMCCDAEDDLKSYGVEFDEKKGITKMTEAGREFIGDSKTPNFVAYFAFGAEYHEFLDLDVQEFPKFSIPLLFAISMIPRFDEQKRRKALSWIRRQIPKIRESFSVAERDEMAFPVNAFEKAYEFSHQKGVESLDKLKTMSRQLLEDKRQRDCQETAENRVAGRIGRKKGKPLKDLVIKYV